eukprot:TRINITY_DN5708_c0_g1_i5.p1 TRINITY_DN5708_c0_g1~~TRINITY_DN5708_c0_g1_i5.p1  ORF type:complete len:370 (+),score=79.50 TRINITY_DN5708_c0_g1_i5:78-1187(+)
MQFSRLIQGSTHSAMLRTHAANSCVSVPIRHFQEIAGTGGRSSVSGIVCAVFGATGFLGRYVVNKLGKIGSQVVVPYRGDPHETRHLKIMGDLGQIVPLEYDPKNVDTIRDVMQNVNCVINLVGRDYSTKNYTLHDVNVKLARDIAQMSTELGVERLIHVSMLGADANSPSEQLRTKAEGEAAVRDAFPYATILRPALMLGTEDRFLNRFAYQARVFPFVLNHNHGAAVRQPVYVVDVATAATTALRDPSTAGNTYELGGPVTYTIQELIDIVYNETGLRRNLLNLPTPVINKVAGLIEKLPFPMLTADQVVLDQQDIVVSENSLKLADLGIEATVFDEYLFATLLKRHRRPIHFSEFNANLIKNPESK